MRFMNVAGRASVAVGTDVVDVERASGGRFSSLPARAFEDWESLEDWAAGLDSADLPEGSVVELGVNDRAVRAPSPQPRQVFAVGLNFKGHAEEARLALPDNPVVFTKFQSSLAGAYDDIVVSAPRIDWEVEPVVVIGRELHRADETQALAAVAGVTVGQDITDRTVQHRPPIPQFSLGKSFRGFGPFGAQLISTREAGNIGALGISCSINGAQMQKSTLDDMIFPIPDLLSRLSHIVTLYPGDVVFCGTPAGVGSTRDEPVFLKPGDRLVSTLDGWTGMDQLCVAEDGRRG